MKLPDWTTHPDPCHRCGLKMVLRRELPVACCAGSRTECRCNLCGDLWAVESHPGNCSALMWLGPEEALR